MPVPRRLLLLLALGGVIATATVGAAGSPAARPRPTRTLTDALARKAREATPEDRYAFAGGCYVAKAAANGRYVTRTGTTFAATATDQAAAERLHFQAFDLGKYLLFASRSDFLAAESGPLDGGTRGAVRPATGYVKGTYDENLKPVRDPALGAVSTATGTVDSTSAPARAATKGDSVVAAAKPSATAEWVVNGVGNAFTLQQAVDDGEEENPGPLDPLIASTLTAAADGTLHLANGASTGNATRFSFELATGCAAWPEIDTQVTGPLASGDTAYEETQGYLDAHLHLMAFEFLGGRVRCGRPWHPYGVTYALVDCPDHEPGGKGAVLEDVLSGNTPGTGHDTVGWPTFGYWPHYNSLTHEQVYYKWLERAWRGGLRMFTNLLVDNGALCEAYPYKKNSCNEMDGVRLQAQRLHELERYIDAQTGGPDEGWFRVVTDPFEARRVVNAGKLAVVMGIEVSVPLDCGEYVEIPRCTPTQITERLDEMYELGVRQMELTNKFDNALTGVTGDGGTTGVVVNNGNKYETGHNWKMHTCDHASTEADRTDNTQPNLADGYDGTAPPGGIGRDAIFGAVLDVSGTSGAAPLYPAGPHCNTIGLSDLGRAAIDGLIERGMIFDPDHMSALARKQSMDYLAARHYSGVVSSHSWADDPTYHAILDIGGVVTPHAGSSTGFVKQWRKLRAWSTDEPYLFGVGYGSDVNGFSAQGAPRHPDGSNDVDYPFTALGGAQVGRQVSGQKTWDVNTAGVDHYGLYPDWVEDGRLVAGADGDAFVADMARGAEAFLQMWERAVGIREAHCLSAAEVRAITRHATPEQVLVAAGQPTARKDATFAYCGGGGTVLVNFGPDGRVRSVG